MISDKQNCEAKSKSRGRNCFKSGKSYQEKIVEKLRSIFIYDKLYDIEEVTGAKSGPDITIKGRIEGNIGIEVKRKGAFEGGSSKMVYDHQNKKLTFLDNTLHKEMLNNKIIYDGKNLPWYEGQKTKDHYKNVQHIFNKEIRIELPDTSMANYYKASGVHYIQVEGYGLYHTGEDILDFGVPYFECQQSLRIRSSKHKKNGIPTDVVGDINYDKKTLKKSDYDLESSLPSVMKFEVV